MSALEEKMEDAEEFCWSEKLTHMCTSSSTGDISMADMSKVGEEWRKKAAGEDKHTTHRYEFVKFLVRGLGFGLTSLKEWRGGTAASTRLEGGHVEVKSCPLAPASVTASALRSPLLVPLQLSSRPLPTPRTAAADPRASAARLARRSSSGAAEARRR